MPDGQQAVKDGLVLRLSERRAEASQISENPSAPAAPDAADHRPNLLPSSGFQVRTGRSLVTPLLASSQAMACFSVADLVDQLQPKRLISREDPAVRDPCELRSLQLPAFLHDAA